MQNDPFVERQRLSETYSKMYDGELLELFADAANLTEQARQALGDEIRKRGLDAPQGMHRAGRPPGFAFEREAVARGAEPDETSHDLDASERDADGRGGLREYTWKTVLCACETQERALQLSEALRRAGVENWIERPGEGQANVWDERTVGIVRILVPADRLEEARAIAEQPIPDEIVEQTRMEVPEFEAPACPKCGAGDPVLEDVDPVNSWLCESCGNQWAEPAGD